MTPYSVSSGKLPLEEYATFLTMRGIVEDLRDDVVARLGIPTLTCHHICHALGPLFSIPVVDGYFGGSFTHSWLLMDFNRISERQFLVDMYPVGGVGAFLVDATTHLPWVALYAKNPGAMRSIRSLAFDAQVAVLKEQMARLRSK